MFGFQEVGQKKFNRNFLKNIVFEVFFDSVSLNLKENQSKIEKIFSDSFDFFNPGQEIEIAINKKDTNFQQKEGNANISIKDERGEKSIIIHSNKINFIIDSNCYTSFHESLLPYINKNFRELFDLYKIEKTTRLSIRKINVINFKKMDNPSGILNFLLHSKLADYINSFPDNKSINSSIQSINYKKDDYHLNINYGFNLPPQLNLETGQLIVDIDLLKKSDTTIKEIEKESTSINSEIFRVFNWIINKKAKEILDNKNV